MKRIIVVVIILAFIVIIIGCDSVEEATEYSISTIEWGVIKSPITGKYYEVAKGGGTLTGFMGMSEINKEEYALARKQSSLEK